MKPSRQSGLYVKRRRRLPRQDIVPQKLKIDYFVDERYESRTLLDENECSTLKVDSRIAVESALRQN